MNFNEARSEAVQGARITSPSIQTGAYIDYQFNGLRITYPSGSSSGFRPTPDDYAADWRIVEERKPLQRPWAEVFADKEPVAGGWIDKPKRDKWGRPT